MKLVPVKQAQAKFFNAPADKGLKSLTLATFKKDRSLTLERDGEGWMLIEDGFEKDRSPLPPGAAGKRLLKDAFKREFPRSANAYLTEARYRARPTQCGGENRLVDYSSSLRREAMGLGYNPLCFCGRSSLVEPQPSKLMRRVRFPSPAPGNTTAPSSRRGRFLFWCAMQESNLQPTD